MESELDRYRHVLPAELRTVWPKLAAVVADISGALFGGTALATHLQHRQSFDLDYMTYTHFDGQALAQELAVSANVEVTLAGPSQLRATVDGVLVEVFSAPHPSDDPRRVKQIAAPREICGLPVASLADLLTSKLDVVIWRGKLRDYIDIAAIDRSGLLRIEDGLRLHCHRYGTSPRSGVLDQIVDMLEEPGLLAVDPMFTDQVEPTTRYLAGRVLELRHYLASAHAASGDWPSPR